MAYAARVLQLRHVIITGTVICTEADSKDAACAAQNYVTSGLSALLMWFNVFFLSYCGVRKPVEYVCPL